MKMKSGYDEKEYLLADYNSKNERNPKPNVSGGQYSDDSYFLDVTTKKLRFPHLIMIIMGTIIVLLCLVVIMLSVLYAYDLRFQEQTCPLPVSNLSVMDLYSHSAIASDAVTCASISNNIMSVKGGNAVDGAIAGLLCTCTLNFHSCGVSGGSFVLIYNKTTAKVHAIDIRETAPGKASENMFNDNVSSMTGGKSIATFGLISGYYEIHQKMGKLEWKTLFEPTIELLNTGFYVSHSLEKAIKYFFRVSNGSQYQELRNILTNSKTGKPKKFGDKIKMSKLARTMTILSQEPHAMKNGSLVDAIITEIAEENGIITKEDLNNYKSKWREPVKVNLGSDRIFYTLPPPSSGVLVAFSLNVLENYNFDSKFLDTCENTGLFFHRLIETMKFSFAKRSVLGDMDFVDNKQLMMNLTSEDYAKWIKSLITDDKTHPINYYNQSFYVTPDHGTSHFSLVSPDGDAVSVTTTINYLFGSLIMGSNTGIVYNDEMDDFSSPNKSNVYNLPPTPSNFIKPYKRPMSSMSPIIIVNSKSGNVEIVLGASGGSQILSSTTMVAVLSVLLNKDIKSAIDAPRVHNQLVPNVVLVEKNLPEPIINSLKKRGHKIEINNDTSVNQGIKLSKDSKFLECNADFRKMGLCDGS